MTTTPQYCDNCGCHDGHHASWCRSNKESRVVAKEEPKSVSKPMTELQLRRISNAEQCNTEATRRYALQYAVQLLGYKPGDAVDMRRAIQTASLIYEWEARGTVSSADIAGIRPASTLQ